jgi:hypothetical protein
MPANRFSVEQIVAKLLEAESPGHALTGTASGGSLAALWSAAERSSGAVIHGAARRPREHRHLAADDYH